MLVEDDSNSRFLFSVAYDRLALPHKLIVCHDGEEAIAYFSGKPPHEDPNRPVPGIIFLDLRMPKVSGFDVLAWLKNHHAEVPVVILTSSALPEDMERAHALGATAYQVKPPSPAGLKIIIEEAVRHLLRTVPFPATET